MPRGISDIPELRLAVLQKFITTFMKPPELLLMNTFRSSISPSSTIKWESMRGGRGMTPFVAPGSPAPRTAPHGMASHQAEAAYWKEKMYFDEEFLNNLRKAGTEGEYMDSKQRLARELAALTNRSNRRKEWMFAQMLFNNGFSYMRKGGQMATVDYAIPSDHRISLTSSYYWDNGASKTIIGDIRDGKKKIKEDNGGRVDLAICNSNVLAMLADDTTIRGILEKNAFGDGSLYKGNIHPIVEINPAVVATLLDIPRLVVYDEMYEVKSWLTAAVTGGSTTWVSVQDASDFVAYQTARFHDVSAGTYEDRVILAVDKFNGRIQVEYPPASSYKAAYDCITMRKYFVPDNMFAMIATTIDGESVAEYKQAPFGLGRHYGTYTDKHEEWDPEGVFIRVQDKGLPILYHRDAIYTIEVTQLAAESQTSTTTTTTTTSSSSTTTTTTTA